MDFSGALNEMKNGKKVRRHSWPFNSYIIYGTKEHYSKPTILYYEINKNGSNSGRIQLLEEDLFADDWEVIEDELPEIKLENQKAVISCKCGNRYNLHSNSTVDYTFRCCLCGREYKIIVEEPKVITSIHCDYKDSNPQQYIPQPAKLNISGSFFKKEERTPVIDFSKLLHPDQIKINFDYRIPRLEIKEPIKEVKEEHKKLEFTSINCDCKDSKPQYAGTFIVNIPSLGIYKEYKKGQFNIFADPADCNSFIIGKKEEPKKDDVLTKYREWLQGIINGYDTKRKHAWIEQDNDAYHFYFKRSLDYSLCLKKLDELEG